MPSIVTSAAVASPAATVQMQQANGTGPSALDASDNEVKRVTEKAKAGQKLDPAAIDKTAREFESMFLSVMLNEMFKGVDMSKGPFGGGHGEDAFKGMLVDEYGKGIAERGGLGIAAQVRRQMLQTQESADAQVSISAPGATASYGAAAAGGAAVSKVKGGA